MKRKLFLLSSIALLGITLGTTACGSTGTTQASSSASQTETTETGGGSSETTGSSETSTEAGESTTESTAPEVTISLSAAKTTLTVGEETPLTATIKNNTSNQAVTYTASDTSIVKIEIREGIAYARGIKKGSAKVTAKCAGKQDSIDLTVNGEETLKADAYTKLDSAMKKAIEYEKTEVKSGTLNQVKKDKNDKVTRDDLWSFEVYSDSKIKTAFEARGSYKEKTTTQYGINGESLVIYKTEEANNETTVSQDSQTIPFGEDTITKAAAGEYMKAVDIDATGDPSKAGVINKIVKEKITGNTAITGAEGKDSLKLVSDALNVYTLTGAGKNGTAVIDFTINYELTNSGALEYLKYSEVKSFTNTGSKVKSSSEEFVLDLTNGAREAAGQSFINFDSLYYTDYVPGLIGDSGDPITTGAVGTGATVQAVSGLPLTASKEIDHLTITKIEPAERAELDEFGGLYFLAPGEVTITTKSVKGVEKTLTVQVEKAPIMYLGAMGLDNPLNINVDNPITFEIYPETALATAEFNFKVTNQGECDAAVTTTKEGGETFYTIKATKPGTATVEITEPAYKDSESGEPIVCSYEVTFIDPAEGGVTVAAPTTAIEAATLLADNVWFDPTNDADMYFFIQLDDQVDTPNVNFTFTINNELIRGSLKAYGSEMDGWEFEVTNIAGNPREVQSIGFPWGDAGQDFTKLNVSFGGEPTVITYVSQSSGGETGPALSTPDEVINHLSNNMWRKDGVIDFTYTYMFMNDADSGTYRFQFIHGEASGAGSFTIEMSETEISLYFENDETTDANTIRILSGGFDWVSETEQDYDTLVFTVQIDDGTPFDITLKRDLGE